MNGPATGPPGGAVTILRTVAVPGILIFLAAVVLGRLPLLNYLGYEYSAAIAFLFPLVPGMFLLRIFGWRVRNAPPGESRPALRALATAVVCLAVPLAVGYANALVVRNCDPGEGAEWYFLVAGGGMAWTAAAAYFCASGFRRPLNWYLLLTAAVIVHPLLLGYFTPRVDSYNFLYGYFPGITYDEDLRITDTLRLFRVVTLVAAAALFLGGSILKRRRARGDDPRPAGPLRYASLFLCLALLAAVWVSRTKFGFETTAGSLRESLGSVAETRHFRIFFDSAAVPADEVRWMAAEHEFAFAEVAGFLEVDTAVVIESYVYPHADAKRRLIGAGSTDIAKPWRGEIHLDGESWRATLKHELAHALAAEFGMPVIGANLNVGLVEGLAMAASPSFGNRTLAEYAASMFRFGIVEDPAALIRPTGFAFQSSTVSYVLMGAFCEHLIGRRGIEPFKLWYGGCSPDEAYGIGVDSLVAEWRASLDSIAVPEEWRAHTEHYFRRGSIFTRECARFVANLNADGARALRARDLGGAAEAFGRALEASWNASSFAGLARTLLAGRQYDPLMALFDDLRSDSARERSIVSMKLLYGDARMMRNDYTGAREVYRELRALDLSPGMNEALAFRLALTDAYDIREYLAPVVAGVMDDSTADAWLGGITAPENPALLSYLRGKVMLSRGRYADAARETANYFAPFADSVLNGALNDITAGAFFRLGDFLSARVFFERTLGYGPGSALRRRTLERIARCEWYMREFPSLEVLPAVVK